MRISITRLSYLFVKYDAVKCALIPLVSSLTRRENFMSQQPLDRPLTVSAKERVHPAFRTLARACIALARYATNTLQPPQSPASASPSEQEGRHA